MKLLFIGPHHRVPSAPLRGLEVDSVARAFRRRFDEVWCQGPDGARNPFVAAFEGEGGRVWRAPEGLLEMVRLGRPCDAVLVYPGGPAEMASLLALLAVAEPREGEVAPVPPSRLYLYDWEKFFAPLRLQLEIAGEMGLSAPVPTTHLRVFEHVDGLVQMLEQDWR